ncbi:hypothetical protein ADK41_17120 [Streptomyces caelestis]|uniref:Uncharacterized protein n=1 Tax=Streptomyces caelestis TaxID=36816 RepID=A0A0N0S5P3_9ACTN|nr:hypothetical protein ADK41_17120 [Streptomyces caelestis]
MPPLPERHGPGGGDTATASPRSHRVVNVCVPGPAVVLLRWAISRGTPARGTPARGTPARGTPARGTPAPAHAVRPYTDRTARTVTPGVRGRDATGPPPDAGRPVAPPPARGSGASAP